MHWPWPPPLHSAPPPPTPDLLPRQTTPEGCLKIWTFPPFSARSWKYFLILFIWNEWLSPRDKLLSNTSTHLFYVLGNRGQVTPLLMCYLKVFTPVVTALYLCLSWLHSERICWCISHIRTVKITQRAFVSTLRASPEVVTYIVSCSPSVECGKFISFYLVLILSYFIFCFVFV